MLPCRIHVGVFVLLAVGGSLAEAAQPEKLSVDVGGVEREAIVYAPASKPKSGSSPLLFVFHGHGGNMKSFARNSRYQEVWPEAIVVYPQGLNTPTRVDPEGKKPGWQRSAGDQKDRDLKFVDAMLAALKKKHVVDDKRVYATGFSNGGVFTYLLWAERPDVFAAFAPCGGLPLPTVQVKVAKPVFIVAGEVDPLVKIADQKAMVERVRDLDGAASPGKSANGAMVYESKQGTPVETLLHSGGHVLPHEAPKLIVDFFRDHELKN